MKVTFNLDSRAGIGSCRSETWDLDDPKDAASFGYTKEEWLALSEDEKEFEVHYWADQIVEIYYEED